MSLPLFALTLHVKGVVPSIPFSYSFLFLYMWGIDIGVVIHLSSAHKKSSSFIPQILHHSNNDDRNRTRFLITHISQQFLEFFSIQQFSCHLKAIGGGGMSFKSINPVTVISFKTISPFSLKIISSCKKESQVQLTKFCYIPVKYLDP